MWKTCIDPVQNWWKKTQKIKKNPTLFYNVENSKQQITVSMEDRKKKYVLIQFFKMWKTCGKLSKEFYVKIRRD